MIITETLLATLRLPLLGLATLAVAGACGDARPAEPAPVVPPVTPPAGDIAIRLEPVASGLVNPVFLGSPAGDARLFIVEQAGRIRIVRNGQLLPTPFLDISSRVRSGGEQGLFSIAFDPQFASNKRFFVDFTDRTGVGNTRVERFTVTADPDIADPASASLAIGIEQPFVNHNGGLVTFGPDGMLYIGMGDGGSAGDPNGNAQNLGVLLGKMLRLDVRGAEPYTIPPDNPFVARTGARPEIWAYGLRNPWRYAFDRAANTLYIADVGQGAREEIDVVDARQGGQNYGWNIMEGVACYAASTCNQTGLTAPVLDYDHSAGNCSITGGYVYRGASIPELAGDYFYSDYCTGWLRSIRYAAGAATDQRDWGVSGIGNVLSFGQDASGEMYVLSSNGVAYRIVRR